MAERLLLVVEDNEGQFDLLQDVVVELNKKDGDNFKISQVADAASAAKALKEIRHDCAIVDLRIPTTQHVRAKKPLGIDIALSAIKEYGIPVVIVSGHIDEIGDRLDNYPMIEKFDKNDHQAFEKALDWLQEQGPMMTSLAHARGKIQNSVADMFSKRIWNQWSDYLMIADSDQPKLNEIVTRQIVTHIAEILGLDHNTNPDWHPFESYIRPPLHADRAQTGDIFEFNDGIWVVLTPQCDMATGTVDNIILAKCEPGKIDGWEQKCTEAKDNTSARQEKSQKFIRKHTNQDLPVSQHFLPPLDARGPLIVTFKVLKTVSKDNLADLLDKRTASMAASFTPNLTQRFGAYISRPGQPNLDPEHF